MIGSKSIFKDSSEGKLGNLKLSCSDSDRLFGRPEWPYTILNFEIRMSLLHIRQRWVNPTCFIGWNNCQTANNLNYFHAFKFHIVSKQSSFNNFIKLIFHILCAAQYFEFQISNFEFRISNFTLTSIPDDAELYLRFRFITSLILL